MSRAEKRAAEAIELATAQAGEMDESTETDDSFTDPDHAVERDEEPDPQGDVPVRI